MGSTTRFLVLLVVALQRGSAHGFPEIHRDTSIISASAIGNSRTAAAQSPVGITVPVGKSHQHDASEVTHDRNVSNREVHVPWVMLPAAGAVICSVIFFIYGPRGPTVVMSVLVYLLSLATMKLSVKWVFLTHDFPYAKFVSSLHFLAGAIVTYGILLRRQVPIPRPTMMEFLGMICPIAFAVVISIGSNNMALVFSTAAFTEIIGATNCLITICMVVLMGLPFDKWLIAPACLVAFGCALGTVGELNFSLLGMILCLISNVFRSLKVTLQQKLMTGERKDRFDPTVLLFWISLPSTVVMWLSSCVTEGSKPYTALSGRSASAVHGLVFAILVSCINATILNLAQLFVTKDLGAVGGQLVAQAKMVLTVLGGMVLFGEAFSELEVIGFGLALCGVYVFSRMDQAFKERMSKQKALSSPKFDACDEASGAKSA